MLVKNFNNILKLNVLFSISINAFEITKDEREYIIINLYKVYTIIIIIVYNNY